MGNDSVYSQNNAAKAANTTGSMWNLREPVHLYHHICPSNNPHKGNYYLITTKGIITAMDILYFSVSYNKQYKVNNVLPVKGAN